MNGCSYCQECAACGAYLGPDNEALHIQLAEARERIQSVIDTFPNEHDWDDLRAYLEKYPT